MESNKRRGRPAFPAELKQYRGYRAVLNDRLAERERIRSNIGTYGIGMFGKYAKANNAGLRACAEVLIGRGC